VGGTVRLELDGPIAVITNENPHAHNAFDDDMDAQLFAVLAELGQQPAVRAIVWRGDGPSFSSGRDVAAIKELPVGVTHHELMRREADGAQLFLDINTPIIAALHGWTIGISFQRALLCDVRICADDTRFKLPEVDYGLIPDGGGVARLTQICGPGVVSDLVLTSRVLASGEALAHGIVSRIVGPDELDTVAFDLAANVADSPMATVSTARRVTSRLANPAVRASMEEEMIGQTFLNQSNDFREMVRARKQNRPPQYRGS
jgi:enoyl-CoA hydratase/carnithine racemase